MNLIALPPLLSIFVISFVGVFVFSHNTKHPVNRLFLILSLMNVYFAITYFRLSSSPNYDTALFWVKAQMIWPLILVLQLHFLVAFIKYPVTVPKRWIYPFYISGIVATCLFMFESNVEATFNGSTWEKSALELNLTEQLSQFVFSVISVTIIVLTLIIGIWYVVKRKGRKRTQIALVLIGIFTPTLYGSIKESTPEMNELLIIPISFTVLSSWIFFTIAIWRYRMFNVTPEYATEKIISTMKEALVLLGKDGKIVDSNKAFCKMFGLEEPGKVDIPFEKLIHPVTPSGLKLLEDYKTKEFKNYWFNHLSRKGKTLTLNFSNSVIRDNMGEAAGYVCVITDVTEFEKAQEQLKNQQQQLANMAHQAGMAEIASNIMHNIGNILNSINVSSEQLFFILDRSKINELAEISKLMVEHNDNLAGFLTRDPKGKLIPEYYSQVAETLQQEKQELKTEGERFLEKIKLIGDTLELQHSYAASGNYYEPVMLSGLLDEVVKILQESFRKNEVDLSVEMNGDESLVVEVPKNKLFNVLLNIIKNAYESVKWNGVNNRLIKVNIFRPRAGFLQIDVADNGVGIAAENLGKVFTFGFTTKESGNGFGLHYCAATLQEMNGSISVKSEGLNKGAVFSVLIPVTGHLKNGGFET